MTPTRFDIYVREDGHWKRFESMPGNDKAAAISRTVGIDASDGHDGVRAMAVVEYGGGRSPLETLAWISPHLNKTASVQRQLTQQAEAAQRTMNERRSAIEPSETSVRIETALVETTVTEPKPGQNASKKSKIKPRKRSDLEIRAARKVLGSAVIAMAITAALFVPLSALVRGLGNQIEANPESFAGITLALTVLLFVTLSAFLMSRVYRDYRVLAAQIANAEPMSRKSRQDQVQAKSRQISRTIQRDEVQDEQFQDAYENTENEVAPAMEVDADEKAKKAALTADMRRAVLEFLANALVAIKDEVPRMNQHVAFGLNLFGAGAAEHYGTHAGLKRFQAFVLVREAVEVLGNSADRVDAFCRQYDDYRAEERFRMMIEAGRETMTRYIEGHADPFENFTDTINMWTSNAAARAQSQGIVCIMFTDLVGSTQMTHERGDYGAQEVVRAHNAIVRSALAAHHGREVKHTGDGIMASFSSTANAVRSATEIRTGLKTHNNVEDAVPVRVRIGLNAGETVQEEDDFFGTTVQLAARVCDKADEGEIFVTDNVRELSKGQGIRLKDAGKYEMKGVPHPMTLYKVVA